MQRSRPPHKHSPHRARVILRHLPPKVVRQPHREYARAHSEYAERTIGVLTVLLVVLVIAMIALPVPTGNTTKSTVNITRGLVVICDFPLRPGIDLISFNCISNYYDRDKVFNYTDTTQIDGMWEYTPNTGDLWRAWNPNLPSWVVHDLDKVSRLKGYIIRINGSGTIVYLNNSLVDTSYVPVIPGPNLVGYPSVIVDPTPWALTTVNTTFRSMSTLRNGSMITYWRNYSGDLNELMPFEGYWLNMSASDTWIVERNRT